MNEKWEKQFDKQFPTTFTRDSTDQAYEEWVFTPSPEQLKAFISKTLSLHNKRLADSMENVAKDFERAMHSTDDEFDTWNQAMRQCAAKIRSNLKQLMNEYDTGADIQKD